MRLAGVSRQVIALMVASLILPVLFAPAYASEQQWKTGYAVGEFPFSDPPKPDQIFKIQYRAINGTVEGFRAYGGVSINIDSSSDGMLEIRYPRNYPYTNEFISEPYVQPLLFINGTETLLDASPTEITECFFVFSIPFSESAEIGLVWTYFAVERPFYGDDVPDSCLPETIVDVPIKKDGTISPLQQFKVGANAKDIVCADAFSASEYRLVIHPDGKPFCVTRTSATELIQRWGVTIPA